MKINSFISLEFTAILQKLSDHAVSIKAKEELKGLSPFLDEKRCRQKMGETTEAVQIIQSLGTPPLAAMADLDEMLLQCEKGAMLLPEELEKIESFIYSCKRMKNYLHKAAQQEIPLGYYGVSFAELETLSEEISRSIHNGAVDDRASPMLQEIRRKIENMNNAVKIKLESILRSKKEYFTDGYVANRNGHFVLPVKKEYKHQFPGSVIETSNSGGTCFIEPAAVQKMQSELSLLQINEENEVRRILYTLTVFVEEHLSALRINMECMAALDIAFAKAKLSLEMKALAPEITIKREIRMKGARHPLLNADSCVPLDFEIGGDIRGVVITGPNTGGKTVALKTIGLLSLMAQSGLHIPALPGSVLCLFNTVVCDIGDGQSITENLSTFSAHITNVIDILQCASDESLVLLDELGSGTDPAEGMGIAVAILEELRHRGCLFVATTHYPEIKEFAKNTEGLINARMEFDRESLRPLYQLRIGEAGESCALYIAQRLGFPQHLIDRANQEAYGMTSVKNEAPAYKNPQNSPRIKKDIPQSKAPKRCERFNMGDSVIVHPQKLVGIVYQKADEKGELIIQIKGKKERVNHKRIELLHPASELYPDNYDFSILFDSAETRKAHHEMERKYNPDIVIQSDQE